MTNLLLALAFLILLTHWAKSDRDFHYKKTLHCERWCDPKPWNNKICLVDFGHDNQEKCSKFTECLRDCMDPGRHCGCSRRKDITEEEWREETKTVMDPLRCYTFKNSDHSHDTDSDNDMKDCKQTPHNLAYCRLESYRSGVHKHGNREYRGCVNALEYCPEDTCCCRTEGCNRDWDTCKKAGTGTDAVTHHDTTTYPYAMGYGIHTKSRHINDTSGARTKQPFPSINGVFVKAALVFSIYVALAITVRFNVL